MTEKNYKDYLIRSFGKSEILKLMKAEIVTIDSGRFEMKIPREKFMLRPAGMYNGSTIASLADLSSGYAVATTKAIGSYFATVELKVNYLSPAIGDELKAKAKVIKSGKILSVVSSDIFSVMKDREKHIATALVTIMQIMNLDNNEQVD